MDEEGTIELHKFSCVCTLILFVYFLVKPRNFISNLMHISCIQCKKEL